MLLTALVLFVMLYALAYLTADSKTYEFDPLNSPGAFSGLLVHYSKLFYFIFTFGLVGAFASLGYIRDDNRPGILLLAAAIYALLFNGCAIFFYESYLHRVCRSGKSSYTRPRYALIQALGWASMLLFVTGAIATYLAL